MDDFLNKELEKNKKLRDVLSKQLEIDKKNFITYMKSDLGETIKNDFIEKKVEKKDNFWQKLKKIFR